MVDILSKSFVRKKVAQYVNECMSPEKHLAPTDVDDIFADVLLEQAEKLQIPGFFQEDTRNSAARLHKGSKTLHAPARARSNANRDKSQPREIKT